MESRIKVKKSVDLESGQGIESCIETKREEKKPLHCDSVRTHREPWVEEEGRGEGEGSARFNGREV